jgi:hypothetical protein
MPGSTRSLRFDLSSTIYDHLDLHAQDLDMGVPDLLRRVGIEWLREHPHPLLGVDQEGL